MIPMDTNFKLNLEVIGGITYYVARNSYGDILYKIPAGEIYA